MSELLNKKRGKCPHCNSKNLLHSEFNTYNDVYMGWYDVKCEKCKKKFKEFYKMSFIGNWGRK